MRKIVKFFLLVLVLWGAFLVHERLTGRLEKSLRMKYQENLFGLIDEPLEIIPILDPTEAH